MLNKIAIRGFAAAVALSVAFSAQVNAQSLSTDMGAFEFQNSCASCHGIDGKGAGPLADMLSTAPSNLTTLQANNGGVFPVSQVYSMIDGGKEVAAHGSREMPVWGMRYMQRADESADLSPLEAEQYPRMRILALVEFLSTIQE